MHFLANKCLLLGIHLRERLNKMRIIVLTNPNIDTPQIAIYGTSPTILVLLILSRSSDHLTSSKGTAIQNTGSTNIQ